MKPAAFSYHRPRSVEEVLALLSEFGFDAKVIAGGQSLAPMMNMRLARPSHLVDLAGVPDIEGIARHDEELRIGAMTRHHEVATSADVLLQFSTRRRTSQRKRLRCLRRQCASTPPTHTLHRQFWSGRLTRLWSSACA